MSPERARDLADQIRRHYRDVEGPASLTLKAEIEELLSAALKAIDHAPEAARLLHTGEGKVLLAMTTYELETAALAGERDLRERALTALALLDPERAAFLRKETV